MKPKIILFLFASLLLITGTVWTWQHFSEEKIDFNADIRPILNTKCISCHGGVKEQAKFSLFSREDALRPSESGKPSLIPGNPEESEMFRRLTNHDSEERMPYHAEPLPSEDIEKIRKWIKQGANWADHWSYFPPEKPVIPEDKSGWAKNPVDNFIAKKHQQEKLQPSPPADKATLLRRLSLDLTGLPPTEQEMGAFQSDNSEKGFEKQVDRLLASPHFGERWAAMWLDLARYSDSKGYEKDSPRNIWRFRDYVIQSFNEDKPFNTFTIEQLGGDLLPDPSPTQLIATAFHRNTANNDEGGTEDEEFRTSALIDRVNNTWETWQGITMGCVQCHSHPYDPIRHDEFYKSIAFFNNTRDEDIPEEYPVWNEFKPEDEAKIENLKAWVKNLTPDNQDFIKVHDLEKLLRIGEPKIYSHAFDSLVNSALIDGKWLGGRPDGFARLKNVNLANKNMLVFAYNSYVQGGQVEIRKDGLKGEIIAVFNPKKTKKDWGGYETTLLEIQLASGVHDLYFVFKNPSIKPDDYVCTFNWFLFLESPVNPKQNAYPKFKQDLLALLNTPTQTTPVLQENPVDFRRKSFVFVRGNWLTKGKEVQPETPKTMPDFQKYPKNRLGLAQWLVSQENPLTARVTVNRFWEQFFGTGIVETLEDFGSQGTLPSNPELLDYLAVTFRDDYKWSVKKLLKLIVSSATYQQSSKVTPELAQKDPSNHFLARGPRIRLTAEQVRDQALAVSGLLSKKMYGKSVMPPQPEGVWQVVYSGNKWQTSHGEDAFRRAVYTFWRRSVPYPSMMTFDAAGREICQSRRIRTNTPLQALVTLNDTVYMLAAGGLADKMLFSGKNPEKQLKKGYYLTVFKEISPEKLKILTELYRVSEKYYSQKPEEMAKLLGKTEAKKPDALPKACLTLVANALLNLDEFVMKE